MNETGPKDSDYGDSICDRVRRGRSLDEQTGGAWHLQRFDRLALCFRDVRDPSRVQHSVAELLAQRVFDLALDEEDRNDHDRLRHDPLLRAMAGKSTLNRLERTHGGSHPLQDNILRHRSHRPSVGRRVPGSALGRARAELSSILIGPICPCMAMTNIAIFRSTCSRAIVDRIRQTWPTVRIIVRGDAGFCREELLNGCERQTVPVD